MPPSDAATTNTPLAPSVEKAYYRKCIELKRRLNEVEAANDDLKIKRSRLDRGIMKMRLERAFLLDELRKRMEHNVDGSEGSGEEGVGTPPPDRPHRDKRRRPHAIQTSAQPPGPASHAHQPPAYPLPPPVHRLASQPEGGSIPLVPGPGGTHVPANARDELGRLVYLPPQELAAAVQQQQLQQAQVPSYPSQPPQHSSPYGAPVGVPGATDRQANGTNLDGAGNDRDREPPPGQPSS